MGADPGATEILDTAHSAGARGAVSPTGTLATQSSDGTIRLWNVHSRKLLRSFHFDVTRRFGGDLAWTAAGDRFVAAVDGGLVTFGLDGSRVATAGVTVAVRSTGDADAPFVTAGAVPGPIRALDAHLAPRFAFGPPADAGPTQSAVFEDDSPRGRWVAQAHEKGLVVWPVAGKGGHAHVLPLPARAVGGAFAVQPGGDVAVYAYDELVRPHRRADGGVEPATWLTHAFVVDLRHDQPPVELPNLRGVVPDALAVSPDGHTAVLGASSTSASDAVGLAAWDLSTRTLRWTQRLSDLDAELARDLAGANRSVQQLVFAPDGRTVVAMLDAGTMLQLETSTGISLGQFGHPIQAARDLAFLGEDRLIATSSGALADWSLPAGRVSHQPHQPSDLPPFVQGDTMFTVRLPKLSPTTPLCPPDHAPLAVERHTLDTDEPRSSSKWLALVKPSAAWPATKWRTLYCVPLGGGDAPGAVQPTWKRDNPIEAWDPSRGLVIVPWGAAKDPLGATPRAVVEIATGRSVVLRGSAGSMLDPLHPFFVAGGSLVAAIVRVPTQTMSGLYVWDAKTGALVIKGFRFGTGPTTAVVPDEPELTAVAVSDDGSTLAAAYRRKLAILTPRHPDRRVDVSLDREATALAVSRDAKTVFVGTLDGDLLVVRDGRVVSHVRGTGGGYVTALAASPGAGVVAAATTDGAIRVFDAEAARLRGTLATFQDDEFVALTPGGAYSGTREVADRVGWVFDRPLERFGFEQFSAAFDSPTLVRRRLAGEAVDVSATVERPPTVTLTPPASRIVSTRSARLHVHVGSAARVDTVRAFVEGRFAAEKAVCAPTGDVDLDVPLLSGRNRVSVIAFDAEGYASNPAVVDLEARVPNAPKPDVWVISVGVSRYPNVPGGDLPAASGDARAVARALSGLAGSGYAKAHVTTLTDDQASPDAIRAALARLSRMSRDDVAFVFLAGHGLALGPGAMVFATGRVRWDVQKRGLTRESIAGATLDWNDMAAAVGHAPGRVVILLDACHSGNVTQSLVVPNESLADSLVREHRAGAIVFSAAKGRQFSLEDPVSKRGFFAGALLASLRSATTDRDHDGFVELGELLDETTRRVALRTAGKQTPFIARRELFGDFVVAPVAPP